ncbi:MAG TPA: GMC oxidoreductase [Devosiaceae bacterium]|jgi:choline dehydrogenase-like flavoprotein
MTIVSGLSDLFGRLHNICIIGAGPVGMVLALEFAKLDQHVTVLESGGVTHSQAAQDLSGAIVEEGGRQVDMSIAVERSLGGTSNLWGAGCVPLDPVDFDDRPGVDAGWPITYAEFSRTIADACAYANCGVPDFDGSLADLHGADDSFSAGNLIRFADPPSFRTAYAHSLRESSHIRTYLDATATDMAFASDGRISNLTVRSRSGETGTVRAKAFIIACGGVESARLLLVARRNTPQRFGGGDGPLGRYYMGHLSGSIADLEIGNPQLNRSFDFYRDDGNRYARRRFAPSRDLVLREHLNNVAFWPLMSPMADPAHRSGILSMAYLALAFPPTGRMLVSEYLRQLNTAHPASKWAHARNIIRDAPAIAEFLPRFLHGRFVARTRLPGLYIRSKAGHYRLHYHAEHLPNPLSRITLTGHSDALGMLRVSPGLRFSMADAEPIVRSHQLLADWLHRSGYGDIVPREPGGDLAASVLAQASDGVHQVGTVRMGRSARTGVVDADCRTFDATNLFVAGSSVFSTSGQANPTFSAICLAVRLARRVSAEIGRAEAAMDNAMT